MHHTGKKESKKEKEKKKGHEKFASRGFEPGPSEIVHQLRAENLGLWLTRGEQPKHVTY